MTWTGLYYDYQVKKIYLADKNGYNAYPLLELSDLNNHDIKDWLSFIEMLDDDKLRPRVLAVLTSALLARLREEVNT